MRRLLLAALLLTLIGCSKAPPTMAGGKWARTLRDPDASLRKKAAFHLGNIGRSDPEVLPALIEGMNDPDAKVRCEVILALSKYGPGAEEAIPALSKLRDADSDATVRDYALKALAKLQGKG
jgi:HEAT repeat protein